MIIQWPLSGIAMVHAYGDAALPRHGGGRSGRWGPVSKRGPVRPNVRRLLCARRTCAGPASDLCLLPSDFWPSVGAVAVRLAGFGRGD